MNVSTIIFSVLAVLGFIASFYIKKASPKYQIILAGALTLYFIFSFFAYGEKFSLILVLLGCSWVIKSIEQTRANQ